MTRNSRELVATIIIAAIIAAGCWLTGVAAWALAGGAW